MKKIFYIIPLALLSLYACKKDSGNTPQKVNVVSPSLDGMIDKNSAEIQSFKLNNENGATIIGKHGTEIKILPYTYGNGTGMVDIELREVYTIKEMLGTGIFTNTADGILESQGMFEITAKMGGNEVVPLKESEITMNIAQGSSTDSTKVFKLVDSKDTGTGGSKKIWQEYDKNWSYDSSRQGKCKFNFILISWCNLDKYIQNNGVNNRISVIPPDGFGSSNTKAYFNLNGVKGLVTLYPDQINKKFTTFPIKNGYSGKIILIALKDNVYYKKILDVTFTNSTQDVTVTDLDETTFDEMNVFLGGL